MRGFMPSAKRSYSFKRADRAMIIVSHHAAFVREHCNRATVLKNGKLYDQVNLDDAFAFYHDETELAA